MDLIANVVCYVYLTSTHFNCGDIGYVSLAPKRHTLLPQAYADHMNGVVSRCNGAKKAQQYLLQRDRHTSVVRLSGEPPCASSYIVKVYIFFQDCSLPCIKSVTHDRNR